MGNITDLRNEIDRLDDEIKRLFLERIEVCRSIGEYKKEKGLAVLDAEREKELLLKKLDGLSSAERGNVERLFKEIMEISKDEQRKICNGKETVGFCGAKGAYGYFVALSLGEKVRAYNTFGAVALAVERGEVDRGVLPIENTTSGSVLEVYDILAEDSLYITEEIVIPISHCLLGLGEKKDIRAVCSHPQALAQCSGFIDKEGYECIQQVNTAIAAKECKDRGDKAIGAIGSESCGELYGLKVLEKAIENKKGNKTRFVVVSAEKNSADYGNKASIVFTLPHKQGALAEMLSLFKDVNLTKIESRPVGEFEYRFYLDFVADNPTEIIDRLTDKYNTVKVLGIYKDRRC